MTKSKKTTADIPIPARPIPFVNPALEDSETNYQPSQIVKYLDGSGSNLRRGNLKLINGGFSVNADRQLLLEQRELREKQKGEGRQ